MCNFGIFDFFDDFKRFNQNNDRFSSIHEENSLFHIPTEIKINEFKWQYFNSNLEDDILDKYRVTNQQMYLNMLIAENYIISNGKLNLKEIINYLNDIELDIKHKFKFYHKCFN